MWTRRDQIGMAGAALMILGAFCPAVSGPFGITINYFNNGSGDGVITVIAGVIVAIAAYLSFSRWIWVVGCIAGGFAGYDMMNVGSRLGGSTIASAQLQWGWIVILLGCIMVVAASFWPIPQVA